MKHYELDPCPWAKSRGEQPLVFDWDSETGDLSGEDAERIRQMAALGSTDAHPMRWAWEFGPEPLKDKTDMAAICGFLWELPEDLAPYYPKPDDMDDDVDPEIAAQIRY